VLGPILFELTFRICVQNEQQASVGGISIYILFDLHTLSVSTLSAI
jgi:hypothetical protein